MEGLVTNTKNKSPFLNLKCTKGENNLIAVTETWLQEDKHYKEEIMRHFPDYSIERADRSLKGTKRHEETDQDLSNTPEEPGQEDGEPEDDRLSSRGGCLLLASPGLTLLPIEKVRNGVCELLICEVPQLNTAVLVVYNPPKPNFKFLKFKEILDKIDEYLKKNEQKGEKQLEIALMGDFNFPPNIVTWEKCDHGLFPDVKAGELDQQKEACRLLVDLMNRYSMFQMVDKPTRHKNILDLFITDDPYSYSALKTQDMKPHSDHKAVSLQLTIQTLNENNTLDNPNIPEAAKYNYYRADKKKVKDAINSTDWQQYLAGNATTDIKTSFDRLVLDCLEKAKVPKIRRYKKVNAISKELQDLKQRASKMESFIHHPTTRGADKHEATAKLKDIHKQMQDSIDASEAKKEKLLAGITKNPRAFYKHINKSRKAKTKIGPLTQGPKYISDPKKMADILSKQYDSVFSEPMEDISHHQNKKLTDASLNDIIITKEDIIQAIKDMPNDSAAGPDGIPTKILQRLCRGAGNSNNATMEAFSGLWETTR